MLNSYFDNKYYKAKLNKFPYFIFTNTYDPKDLRFHHRMTILSTLVATVFLGAISPYLIPLLIYDYYLLLGFTKVLN